MSEPLTQAESTVGYTASVTPLSPLSKRKRVQEVYRMYDLADIWVFQNPKARKMPLMPDLGTMEAMPTYMRLLPNLKARFHMARTDIERICRKEASIEESKIFGVVWKILGEIHDLEAMVQQEMREVFVEEFIDKRITDPNFPSITSEEFKVMLNVKEVPTTEEPANASDSTSEEVEQMENNRRALLSLEQVVDEVANRLKKIEEANKQQAQA